MCELFGMTGADKRRVDMYLKEFFSHSTEHPDGWGMAFFFDNSVSLEKEPLPAHKSSYLKSRINDQMKAQNMFAHIRLATKGNHAYVNCHPFVKRDISGRTWTLMHNGTIFACEKTDPYLKVQEGQTDSERILFFIMDRIDQATKTLGHALNARERFDIVDEVVCEITKGNNKVNLLIYDSELMYVHTNMAETLFYKEVPGNVIFATVPLDHEEWHPVEFTRLLAFKDDKLVFKGTNHGNEYHYNYDDMKYLYLDVALL